MVFHEEETPFTPMSRGRGPPCIVGLFSRIGVVGVSSHPPSREESPMPEHPEDAVEIPRLFVHPDLPPEAHYLGALGRCGHRKAAAQPGSLIHRFGRDFYVLVRHAGVFVVQALDTGEISCGGWTGRRRFGLDRPEIGL